MRRVRSLCALSGVILSLFSSDFTLGQHIDSSRANAPKLTGDEFAGRGPRATSNIKYGEWQKFCFKPGGAKSVCRTTIVGSFDTGQIAVRVYIIEREGDGTSRLQLFLPTGLYMPAGVKMSIDGGTARKIPFTWCLTNTCVAADLADPALLRDFDGGKNLGVEVVDTNLLAVTTTIPLNRFSAVRRGVPIQTFEQTIDE